MPEQLEVTLTSGLDDEADQMDPRHCQQITQALLSGEYGRDVAMVVTRLVMNLARARGVETRDVDTEGGEPDA